MQYTSEKVEKWIGKNLIIKTLKWKSLVWKYAVSTASHTTFTEVFFNQRYKKNENHLFRCLSQGSIQQFFLMWSQFLHECKHYWKISHQRLAEERFRKGLNQKIKMVSN